MSDYSFHVIFLLARTKEIFKMLVLHKRTEQNISEAFQEYCCKNGAACIQPVRFYKPWPSASGT
jgi:hypothetical protein